MSGARLGDGRPCARCGETAEGFATVNDERLCHGDQQRPSCYEATLRSRSADEDLAHRLRQVDPLFTGDREAVPILPGLADANRDLLGVDDVCPRCGNGRPICTDTKPDGTRYTHAETCATYDWADVLCDRCLIVPEEAL